jgi:STE24 endopeptidase
MSGDQARVYHRLQLWLSALGSGLWIAYLVALITSGAASALAAWAATLIPRWWLQLAVLVTVLAGAWQIGTLPLAWVRGYWLPRRFGLLHQPLAGWLLDVAKAAAIGGALGLVAVEIVYALLRLTPWWWLWAALVFFAAAAVLTLVAPVWLVPLFYTLTPLPDGELKDRLIALGARAGVPVLGVWITDQSRKSRTANAAVTGLAGTRRIILFDTLVREFTADEVEAVLAHELAHHAHADIWRGLFVQAALTLVTFRGADWLLGAGSAALGLAGRADPAGLPLFGLVLTGLGVAALPVANGWSRRVERQADDFALRTTGNVQAFVGAMERLAGLNLAERDPHPIKEFFLYSHPSIARRVARAQALLRSPG